MNSKSNIGGVKRVKLDHNIEVIPEKSTTKASGQRTMVRKMRVPLGDSLEDEGDDDGENGGGEQLAQLFAALQANQSKKDAARRSAFLDSVGTLCEGRAQGFTEYRNAAFQLLDGVDEQFDAFVGTVDGYHQQLEDLATSVSRQKVMIEDACGLLEVPGSQLAQLALVPAERAMAQVPRHRKLRERSRKKIMKDARNYYAEALEKQKLATDAEAYIRHYKKLILL